MSIQVLNLSKVYGTQKAIDNIAFDAHKGQILGFLGPNGAGKTTTMKIIACFIPQTDGNVTVCGYDTQQQSMEVRKCIGYLPEHNPLYLDMYVKEYLLFVGKLHQIKGKNAQNKVQQMIELTGLEREQHKQIGQLSKGYRQRVGLAQAMLHDPQVLILDEPTAGLDPNQLAEIRAVIKTLGKEKTVILSTHIMQEVQALCDRVIIINRGNLVADSPTDQLHRFANQKTHVVVEFEQPVPINELNKINNVQHIETIAPNTYRLSTTNNEDIRPNVFQFAVQQQRVLIGLQREESPLEDIFRQLTQTNTQKTAQN